MNQKNTIKAGTKNEIIKLLSQKKYQILIVLTFLLSIGTNMFGGFTKKLIGISSVNAPLTTLSILTGFILPLIIAMATADLFTAEQENGSIKSILTRPVSRVSIFLSKISAVLIYSITILTVALITSLAYNILFIDIRLLNLWEIILSYAVSIIPMLSIILFAAAISQLCKNSSSTVMMFVFGYIAIIIAGIVFSSISPMLFTTYTGWYKLFIGAKMPIAKILNILILLTAYSLIFFSAGLFNFEKKEY